MPFVFRPVASRLVSRFTGLPWGSASRVALSRIPMAELRALEGHAFACEKSALLVVMNLFSPRGDRFELASLIMLEAKSEKCLTS